MKIAVTGATGFLGRYIVRQLAPKHCCRCWYRPSSDRGAFEDLGDAVEWVEGELGNVDSHRHLVTGCEAVVHAALEFEGGSRNSFDFKLDVARRNIQGSLELMEIARRLGIGRFVYISSCAVYGSILEDRPLDEAHPLYPTSHYGAHKAAVEAFVHSYGAGETYSICALRPVGIYGINRPIEKSKWYDLVRAVVEGREVRCQRGGKEVHVADVARAVETLLTARHVIGEAYNCYDRYVSEFEVATLAKQLSGSNARIEGAATQPKHQIVTQKLRALGVEFGGQRLFEETIGRLVAACRKK